MPPGGLRAALLRSLKPMHRCLRQKKIGAFLRLVAKSRAAGRLLDVGGSPGIDGEFLDLYARFDETVVVNSAAQRFYPPNRCHLESVQADGRDLPFDSHSFEWVFSNAVIEHVGDWRDQMRFANEIRRVASTGYFVTTPNRLFPIEQHTLFPFYQFLPTWTQKKVAPHTLGYLRQYEEVHLLSRKEFQQLFPEATVWSMGCPLIGSSLVAFHFKEGNQ